MEENRSIAFKKFIESCFVKYLGEIDKLKNDNRGIKSLIFVVNDFKRYLLEEMED